MGYAYTMSFERTIHVVQNQTKLNNAKVMDKHKMALKIKAWMAIPLCQMISMLVV